MKELRCLVYFCIYVSVTAWDLTLLHTNDVHARVEETNIDSGKCTKGSCFAGVARRFSKIKEIRSRERNVMLLDAGDQFQGTVWFNFYKGAEAAHFMNKLGYDAMALGNHEFDNGVEGLIKPFLQQVQCTVLSANIKPDDKLAPQMSGNFFPFKIFDVDSQKVGVVGYTSQETPALSQPGPNVQFQEEFVMTGQAPSSEVPAGLYPFMVKSEDGRDVPVVQAYAFGKYLGYLKVTFSDTGDVLKATGNPILLDSTVPEDPDILADVQEWKKNLANYSSQYVGQTLVYLNGTFQECRFRECNLGNLICDAMVHHNIKYADELQWNHVSSCIFNGGGIRTSIDERSRNGSITMEDLISVLPFGGTFDMVQMKGTTLLKVFEHSVRRYGGSTGEFLQVSGFHVEYDISRVPGERVQSVSVLCTSCRVPIFEPLEPNRLYKMVLPSYLVEGGDGFSMIKEERLKHDSGDLDIAVLASYISERKKVHPAVEGRIRMFSSSSGRSGSMFLLILVGLLLTQSL
ncbi:5'-nucleotidase isoform X3 [Hypomesus transpacificus]|uniref:5'-nucleotidase isoform X3 n=1 Tax=Hypomesus transpacificus TaxID=137520 RepID=UPI001F0750E4|nr:5'-nucleotidase isoform X3 [Hypomesus transpacificus]